MTKLNDVDVHLIYCMLHTHVYVFSFGHGKGEREIDD